MVSEGFCTKVSYFVSTLSFLVSSVSSFNLTISCVLMFVPPLLIFMCSYTSHCSFASYLSSGVPLFSGSYVCSHLFSSSVLCAFPFSLKALAQRNARKRLHSFTPPLVRTTEMLMFHNFPLLNIRNTEKQSSERIGVWCPIAKANAGPRERVQKLKTIAGNGLPQEHTRLHGRRRQGGRSRQRGSSMLAV